MKIPEEFPPIKKAPKGHKWIYRGFQWESTGSPIQVACITDSTDHWSYFTSANGYNLHYAELVEDGVKYLSLEEQILLAKSYVGKTVVRNCNKSVVKSWHVTNNPSYADHGMGVVEEVHQNGVCVYLLLEDKRQIPIKTDDLKEVVIPDHYELILNPNYTAKVYKDTLEVGCQTFPITILDDLKALHKKLVD